MTLCIPQGKTWRLLPGSDDSKLDGVEGRRWGGRGEVGGGRTVGKKGGEIAEMQALDWEDGGLSCCFTERYRPQHLQEKQVIIFA